jgi:hypothetical protein
MFEYVFDFRRLEVYEVGAKLMTLLAFPEINAGGRRGAGRIRSSAP